MLSLHFACDSEVISGETIQFLLSYYLGAASLDTWDGWLPLHFAARREAPAVIIESLLEHFPDGALAHTSNGDSPFGFSYHRFDIIRLLVGYCPACLRTTNTDGDLPLHRILSSAAPSLEVVQFSVESFPDSIRWWNTKGLPLHFVASYRAGAQYQVIRFLVEQNPTSFQVRGSSPRRPPLHDAASTRSMEAVQYSIDQFACAVSFRDGDWNGCAINMDVTQLRC